MQELIRPYTLPDSKLPYDTNNKYNYLIWQPTETCIVLGRSNQLEESVIIDKCIADEIPIYKRPTGGQAVILSPKMLAVSIAKAVEKKPSQEYFRQYNEKIISALQELGVKDVKYRGISDIAINDRKIAGTALYRNRHNVFYHAIINVGEDPQIIQNYLKFPPRIPDYRENRSHIEFVTSLVQQGYEISLQVIKRTIASKIFLPD